MIESRLLGLLLALGLAGGAAVRTQAQDGPTLLGAVGPGFTIQLRDSLGQPVTHLDPGTYVVQVDDRTPGHNFHLFGPGVDQATDILGVGTSIWTVTLQDGVYAYVCDVHVGEMSGGFGVGGATVVANAPEPVKAPMPMTMTARVTGRKVVVSTKTAMEGAYAITVRDTSRTANFHLRGPGVDRKTSIARTSSVSWHVTLKPGSYSYGSDSSGKLTGAITVLPA